MKKENFTLDLNASIARFAKMSIFPVLLMLFSFQASAQCPLGCNNSVQISLDNSCNVTITPDMILEGQGTELACSYTVAILDANENPMGNVVNASHIGMTLKVRVSLGNNSCWGWITVEDKLRPTLECPDDVTISCYDTFVKVPPVGEDNCTNNVTVIELSDETTDLDCNAEFSAERVITYVAEDSSGNRSDICSHTVYYRRITLEELEFPLNFDGTSGNMPALTCEDYTSFDTTSVGYPFLDVTGAPATADGAEILTNEGSSNTFCELNATFNDQILPICENSFKVLRTFTVLDWCTAEVREEFQIIKITDTEPPLVSTLQDDEFAAYADPYTCLAEFDVPAPVEIYDCSDNTEFIVEFALAINGEEPEDGLYYTDFGGVKVNGSFETGFTIVNLPLGVTWIRYTITDPCGNSTEAFTEITVIDNIAPVAVCDEFTVVTLTTDGMAYIFAETFNDGSFDNCQEVTISARRGNAAFGNVVEFNCSDVGQDVMVEMQVREDRVGGLTNSCMVVVHVQDKIDPIIICPDPITISCDQDYTDLSITGEPEGFDNCSVDEIVMQVDNTNLDDCGVGTVTRSWVITDNGGRSANCSQTITIINNNPFNGFNPDMLSWPEDEDLEGCMNMNTAISQTGAPDITANSCSLVAYTSSDRVFTFQDGACFKILRTFTVIDWCQYNPDNGNDYGIWQHTQVIKLNNNNAPTFGSCGPLDRPVTGPGCGGMVTLTQSATDDCPNVTEEELVFTWAIDADDDGSVDFDGTGNDASRVLPVGMHSITWTVEDGCGNQRVCTQTINVRDAKKPTPYCLSEITTVVMPSSGVIQIWASDFNLGSTDNCPGDLTFTFGSTGTNFKTFDCDDVNEPQDLEIVVTDAAGNSDFCMTTINIQANSGCEGARIAGAVSTEGVGMVEDVEVMLENMTTHEERYFMTSETGNYQFVNIPANTDYEVTATREDIPTNGVSTLDLVLIQRHILGFSDLGSPYKVIAADINRSNSVSAADINELRKVVLGVQSDFNNNTSWRFVDGGQSFPEVNSPWPVKESIAVEDFIDNNMDNNFVAIKVGDVNGNASNNANGATQTEVRSGNTAFNVTNTAFTAGETVSVDVTADNFSDMAGLQFTLDFDASVLDFVTVEGGSLNLNENNIGTTYTDRGELTASWNTINSVTADSDEVLFTLVFRAKANSDLATMTMTNNHIQSETYTQSLEINSIELNVRDAKITGEAVVLGQNRPNPFVNQTEVTFNLPTAGQAILTIYDINGRQVSRLASGFDKGANAIMIDAQALGTSAGVFYYTLEANGQVMTKKMILLSK